MLVKIKSTAPGIEYILNTDHIVSVEEEISLDPKEITPKIIADGDVQKYEKRFINITMINKKNYYSWISIDEFWNAINKG